MAVKHYLYYKDNRLVLDPKKLYRVGRDPSNEIYLSEKTVSRIHALIRWEGRGFCIEDQDSTNGLEINHKKTIKGSLKDEDIINIGLFSLVYRCSENQPASNHSNESPFLDTVILEDFPSSKEDNPPRSIIPSLLQKQSRSRRSGDNQYSSELIERELFDEIIKRELKQAKNYGHCLCLLLIALDPPHETEEDLKIVAGIVRKKTRSSDLLARYDEQELAMLLPGIPITNAKTVAEKLQRAVEYQSPELSGYKITISQGVICLPKKDLGIRSMLKQSRQLLEKAKENGPNSLWIYDEKFNALQ